MLSKTKCLCVALSVVFIVLVGFGGWWGRYVPFSEQWPLYEALRTTASIIFAVVGAWLAIIYPERLKMSFGQKQDGGGAKSSGGMSRLLTPAAHSTVILAIILFIGVIAPLAKQLGWVLLHKEVFRGASYAVLVALTLWQLWTVILTLTPTDAFKRHLDEEAFRGRAMNGLFGNAHKEAP